MGGHDMGYNDMGGYDMGYNDRVTMTWIAMTWATTMVTVAVSYRSK
jgi:hypothetical protein